MNNLLVLDCGSFLEIGRSLSFHILRSFEHNAGFAFPSCGDLSLLLSTFACLFSCLNTVPLSLF